MRAITATSATPILITTDFAIMNYYRLISEAVQIHKQLIANQDAEPQVIDLALEKRADQIHRTLFTKAPYTFFEEYVLAVHHRTGRPTWLFNREGVRECLERMGANFHVPTPTASR